MATVAETIAQVLKNAGAEYAFGIPGGEVAPLIEALAAVGIKFVLTKHETAAGFMADAYWRRTGKLALCVTTLGPGVANAVNGIAQAYLDRSPVVLLTGSIDSRLNSQFPHQVFDHNRLYQPITKFSAQASPKTVQPQLMEALDVAYTQPFGPIHLDIPVDVSMMEVPPSSLIYSGARTYAPGLSVDAQAFLSGRLAGTLRPILIVGLEVLNEGSSRLDQVSGLIRQSGIPVFTTYKARGIVDETSDLSLGPVGLSPVFDRLAVEALEGADVVLLMGLDNVELRGEWASHFNRLGAIRLSTHQDDESVFRGLARIVASPVEVFRWIGDAGFWPEREGIRQWASSIKKAQGRLFTKTISLNRGLSPSYVLRRVAAAVPSNAIVTIDTGAMRILANHVWPMGHPLQVLQSNGLGTMGYGLPAAIGAGVGNPATPIVALVGDGGLLMFLGEMGLLNQYAPQTKVIVFVDQELALIRLKQERSQLRRTGVEFPSLDFVAMARGFGGIGWDVQTPEDLERALHDLNRDRDHFVLMAVHIDPDEYARYM